MCAGDLQIRRALRERLDGGRGAGPDTRVVEELAVLGGESRVDVAVINGRLEGFEIKSDVDTLRRLPRQIEIFGRVFDRMTLVCGERRLDQARELTPAWWGLEVASGEGRKVRIRRRRPARANPAVDALALAQLLWREETLAALEEIGHARGLRGQPRRVLWPALAEAMPLRELKGLVSERLRTRPDWRADRPPLASGER